MTQILFKSGRQFAWGMGWMANTLWSFDKVDDKLTCENSIAIKGSINNGTYYTSIVEVRDNGVKAIVDGKLVLGYSRDYQTLSLSSNMRLRNNNTLGVGNYLGPFMFRDISIREVTGKGRFTRGDQTSQVAALNQAGSANSQKEIVGKWKYNADHMSISTFQENGIAINEKAGRNLIVGKWRFDGKVYRVEWSTGSKDVITIKSYDKADVVNINGTEVYSIERVKE
jgi:hypothetical protein